MDLLDDLATLTHRYSAAQGFLTGPHLHTVVPERSGWSAAGHLWHTEASATGVLMSIARIVAGRGDALTPAPEAIAFLQHGVFPTGRQAPTTVRPPDEGVDAEALAARLARNAAAFARLDPAALTGASGTLPHPVLGPLTPVLWVRFARIHAAHHDAIATRVLMDATAATAHG